MTVGVELDAENIAAAVRTVRDVADLAGGTFGEIVTYLPGRRVSGVRVRPDSVTIGVVGRYPATVTDIDAGVRAAVGPLDRPLHLHIADLQLDDIGSTTVDRKENQIS